jgi:hypothetical protein
MPFGAASAYLSSTWPGTIWHAELHLRGRAGHSAGDATAVEHLADLDAAADDVSSAASMSETTSSKH